MNKGLWFHGLLVRYTHVNAFMLIYGSWSSMILFDLTNNYHQSPMGTENKFTRQQKRKHDELTVPQQSVRLLLYPTTHLCRFVGPFAVIARILILSDSFLYGLFVTGDMNHDRRRICQRVNTHLRKSTRKRLRSSPNCNAASTFPHPESLWRTEITQKNPHITSLMWSL